MRAYRARDRRELARLQQVREHLIGNNTFTRRRFEERCGWDRRVLVISKEEVPLTSGLVIGFLPGEELLVRDEAGKELRVRLEEVAADAGFRYESPAETVASDPEIQSSSAAPETIGTAGHQRRYWLLPARSYADGHFETPGGQDEIRRMRLGWNELSVIKVCHAYVRAQRDFALKQRGGQGAVQYAQQIRSSPGKRNGLYWKAEADEEQSLLGLSVAKAHWEGSEGKANRSDGQEGARPFHGYFFKILTQQGKYAADGRCDYLHKGRMVAGFAYLAYPAHWGYSGVMTFIVNHEDKIYEKNLGPRTGRLAPRMASYDPDDTWSPSE